MIRKTFPCFSIKKINQDKRQRSFAEKLMKKVEDEKKLIVYIKYYIFMLISQEILFCYLF